MDFTELLNLITIRSYVVNNVANPIFDKKTIKELDGILILLDRKIAVILTGAEFKEYIGFGGVQQAIQDVRQTKDKPMIEARNIMSGIRK